MKVKSYSYYLLVILFVALPDDLAMKVKSYNYYLLVILFVVLLDDE